MKIKNKNVTINRRNFSRKSRGKDFGQEENNRPQKNNKENRKKIS